jgi:flagellar hook-associated protein 3 FlgL
MAVTRVGTFSSQSFVMDQINNSLLRYVQNQEQITTGQKAQRFSGISDQAALAIDLANSKETIDRYKKSADTTNSRISAIHAAVASTLDMATKFRSQLIQGLTANQAPLAQLEAVAEGYLKQMESSLNTDLGGVYLFGGTKSDTPPVDLSDPVNNRSGQYYNGAETLLTARVDENLVMTYGAPANREGFQKLISSLQRVNSAVNDPVELKTALDDVNVALSDLTQLEAEVGHSMALVESAQERNVALEETVVTQLGSIRDVDISLAMVNLTQRQTILQASYQVIARASQLTLTNFL